MSLKIKNIRKCVAVMLLILFVFQLASCSSEAEPEEKSEVKIDYGSSELYSKKDMDAAIKVIKDEFGNWKGFELQRIYYSSDDECNEENIDWILKNFIKISDFLSESRRVMSAISIYKKASTLEEYKNYGFILDVIDYLIDKGNQILSTKSDAEIEQVFAGGREELISIIDSYKKEKNNEIVFAESDNNDAKKSK